eukprot:4919070-Prymnesium_polylepis.1
MLYVWLWAVAPLGLILVFEVCDLGGGRVSGRPPCALEARARLDRAQVSTRSQHYNNKQRTNDGGPTRHVMRTYRI